jgi:hypothetical protein
VDEPIARDDPPRNGAVTSASGERNVARPTASVRRRREFAGRVNSPKGGILANPSGGGYDEAAGCVAAGAVLPAASPWLTITAPT